MITSWNKVPDEYWATSLTTEFASVVLHEIPKDNPLLPLVQRYAEHILQLQIKIDKKEPCACNYDDPNTTCMQHVEEKESSGN